MTINREAFVQARKAKDWSQADLAAAADVSQQTIGKIEAGTAKRSRFLPALARALDVDASTLDDDFSPPPAPVVQSGYKPPPLLVSMHSTIPVFASAEGGPEGSLIISTEEIDRVPRPFTLENVKDAYGILVEGESMDPAFEPGDIAWVNPLLRERRNSDAIIYAPNDETGQPRALIKRIVSWTDSEWSLKQYNPREIFRLPRDPWRVCHRVVGKLSRR